MFSQQPAAGPGNTDFKRDVHFTHKESSESTTADDSAIVASGITDFKAFAEVNRDLIARMRH